MSIRPDPQRAERNLRNAIKVYVPHQVSVYVQDIVEILAELDRARAAAVSTLDLTDPASVPAMRAARAGRG